MAFHLVGALKRTAFPYAEKATDWPENVKGKLRLIDPALHTIFEEAQPFCTGQKTGRDPKREPLWILNELWNGDKHRAVNVTTTGTTFNFTNVRIPDLFPTESNLSSKTIDSWPLRPIQGKTEVARIIVTTPGPVKIGSQPTVYVQPNFTLGMLFGQSAPAERENVLDVLQAARNAVVDFTNKFD